jgi:hypothetical protein
VQLRHTKATTSDYCYIIHTIYSNQIEPRNAQKKNV